MNIETLSEFIEWASQFNDEKYLFRGVSKDCYKIEASAYRRLTINKTAAQLLKVNQELIKDARGRGHDQKNGQRLSDLELLAELQHFGAATCLIDFSSNALVALWFACQQSSKGKQKNGKVFAVRDVIGLKKVTPDLIEKNIDHFFKLDELSKYPLYQWEPKLQNNRIIAQHSVFVFGGDQIEAEAECVIMQSGKQEILKSLDQVSDITEASMYPDFDGFARLHAHNKPYIEPDARGHLRRGIEEHQRNHLDSAINYYSTVIGLDPEDTSVVAQAYYNRGVAYGQRDDYECAIADYTHAIQLKLDFVEAYNNRGIAYEQSDDYERAIADYTHAIQLNPNYADVYYNRGIAYEQSDDYERAIADYTQTIQLNPNYANAYYNRGIAYGQSDDYERAIADYTHAIQLNPNYVGAYNNRGIAYRQRGDYERAIVDCTQAIQLKPDLAEAYSNRGLAYEQKGDYEQAIADCTQAIQLKPNFVEAYYNRGIAYEQKGSYEYAITDYTKTIELNPNHANAYNNRGAVYYKKGDYELAVEDFGKAIERNPNHADAYNNRGAAHSNLGHYNRAIADYTQAIELNPNYVGAYNNRGRAYTDKGDYNRAIEDFDRAIQLDPQNSLAPDLRDAAQRELEKLNESS